jgi:hypothetical protein
MLSRAMHKAKRIETDPEVKQASTKAGTRASDKAARSAGRVGAGA